jgi:hypothetical protein
LNFCHCLLRPKHIWEDIIKMDFKKLSGRYEMILFGLGQEPVAIP